MGFLHIICSHATVYIRIHEGPRRRKVQRGCLEVPRDADSRRGRRCCALMIMLWRQMQPSCLATHSGRCCRRQLKQAARLCPWIWKGASLGKMGARGLPLRFFRSTPFITFANLEDTGIGDEGVGPLAEAGLCTHPNTLRLDLGYNGVSGKGVKALSVLLLDSPSPLPDPSGTTCSRLNMLSLPRSRRWHRWARPWRRRAASCSSRTWTTPTSSTSRSPPSSTASSSTKPS